MKKRNVKIIYQYDGSKFLGFQRQKHSNVKTVQGEIEKVILKAFSQKINMISSGRTDKGVHAIEQVSNFLIDDNIPFPFQSFVFYFLFSSDKSLEAHHNNVAPLGNPGIFHNFLIP